MICIISEEYDMSTYKVIRWLLHNQTPFLRINEDNKIRLREVIVENNETQIRFDVFSSNWHFLFTVDSSKISSYWYRRGTSKIQLYNHNNNLLGTSFVKYFKDEEDDVNTFFNLFQTDLPHINNHADIFYNKLYALKCANSLSLNTPETLITSSKKKLSEFYHKHGKKIITKGIWNDSVVEYNEDLYKTRYNGFFDYEELENIIPDTFPPAMFQNYIEKILEIRTMYLNDKFYSMAIFSQQNNKTKIDFRNYDYDRPYRLVPFILPKEIEVKLKKLYAKLSLNSGSADIIYSVDNDFYFLEINPIGQFDWLSKECNYYLEKEIANILG